MPSLADFIKTGSTASVTGWCRPVHRTTCCMFVSGGNSCCFCIPSTATCFVVEMWGQGGGGGGSCCCQWGPFGGQGGDYAWLVCTTSGTNHILCGCVCQCSCCACSCCGHAGQFARLTQCNAPSNIWCVGGGAAGCNSCFWGISCGPTCNTSYNTWNIVCTLSAAPSGGTFLDFRCNTQCNPGVCTATWTQTTSSPPGAGGGLDTIFAPVTCACFAFYRRGACGWSNPGGLPGWANCCTPWAGVGGASYAGADQNPWAGWSGGSIQPAYCGQNGHFPGGGGKGAGSCGSPCCSGGAGGDGLILISYS